MLAVSLSCIVKMKMMMKLADVPAVLVVVAKSIFRAASVVRMALPATIVFDRFAKLSFHPQGSR